MSEKSILVVDDSYMERQLFTELLKKIGLTCKLASNGKEALELMNKYKFDLVITDVKMPEMDGIELVKEIRKNNKKIHIIICSGYYQGILDLEKYDIDYIFLKPFSIMKFMDRISKINKLLDEETA